MHAMRAALERRLSPNRLGQRIFDALNRNICATQAVWCGNPYRGFESIAARQRLCNADYAGAGTSRAAIVVSVSRSAAWTWNAAVDVFIRATGTAWRWR